MASGTVRIRSLRSITRGAALFLLGLGVMNVAGFALSLLLTRHLGAAGYGIYTYTITVVGMTLMVTTLGSETSILKYLPEFEESPSRQRSILGLAYLTSFLGGVAVAVGLYIAAVSINAYTLREPIFVDILQLFAFVVVVRSMARIVNSTFRGLELLEYEVLTSKVVGPVTNIACVAAALALGLSMYGIMAALVLATVLTFWFGVYLLLTRVSVRPALASPRSEILEYYNFSVPLTMNGAGQFFKNRIDILLVGILLSSTAVGIYNIALLLASALAIPLTALNQLFPPVASRLHSNAQASELNSVYRTITRWSFTVSLIVAIVVLIYRREFLAIFGSEFLAGAAVLVLILFGQLADSASGPTNHLLMMTGHQYVTMGNKIVFGLLNVGLTYYLILEIGLVGAGLGTFLMLLALNFVKLGEVWYLERLFPFSTSFLKPLIAGGGAAIAMYGVSLWFSGIPLLLVGTGVGISVYGGLLVGIGVETADKELFREVTAAYHQSAR